jgi:hypothetical protein
MSRPIKDPHCSCCGTAKAPAPIRSCTRALPNPAYNNDGTAEVERGATGALRELAQDEDP